MGHEAFLAAIVLAAEQATPVGSLETDFARPGCFSDLASDYRSFLEDVVEASAMDVADGDEVDSQTNADEKKYPVDLGHGMKIRAVKGHAGETWDFSGGP